MKIAITSTRLFIIAFLLLIVTNIIVLFGVASNRAGKPEFQITLTERELAIPYRVHKENSGLALQLTWHALEPEVTDGYYHSWRSPAWLNAEKLNELGFDIENDFRLEKEHGYYKKPIPKEVFFVLENNSDPYKKAVERAEKAVEKARGLYDANQGDKELHRKLERAQKNLSHLRVKATRLYAIDAGITPSVLKNKYNGRPHIIIIKGLVTANFEFKKNIRTVYGYISRLTTTNIHVPLKHRGVLDAVMAKNTSRKAYSEPRYTVELAYGKRFEPWIISVSALEKSK